jgi:hypothetical protein
MAGDLLIAGNSLLSEVYGTVAGTITVRGGSPVAFTGARITRHVAAPADLEQSHDELDLSLVTTGIASAPARDSSVTLTAPPTGISTGPWRVYNVSQQSPGGVTVAYRLELRRVYLAGVLQTWAPGSTGG